MPVDPKVYDSWYDSARGKWIAEQEFSVLTKLFALKQGQSLLDVGCGTGYFTQRFHQVGLQVTGLDADEAMIDFANEKHSEIDFISGSAMELPYTDNTFDYCSAVTSLCFVTEPDKALAEMLRVSRKGVLLGLLNRHSLLYYQKRNSGGYRGARWNTSADVKHWCNKQKSKVEMLTLSAVWIPSNGILGRTIESLLPNRIPCGSFLAAAIKMKNG